MGDLADLGLDQHIGAQHPACLLGARPRRLMGFFQPRWERGVAAACYPEVGHPARPGQLGLERRS
jgi:hypothetical protein